MNVLFYYIISDNETAASLIVSKGLAVDYSINSGGLMEGFSYYYC
jgi:hypothetical protein